MRIKTDIKNMKNDFDTITTWSSQVSADKRKLNRTFQCFWLFRFNFYLIILDVSQFQLVISFAVFDGSILLKMVKLLMLISKLSRTQSDRVWRSERECKSAFESQLPSCCFSVWKSAIIKVNSHQIHRHKQFARWIACNEK